MEAAGGRPAADPASLMKKGGRCSGGVRIRCRTRNGSFSGPLQAISHSRSEQRRLSRDRQSSWGLVPAHLDGWKGPSGCWGTRSGRWRTRTARSCRRPLRPPPSPQPFPAPDRTGGDEKEGPGGWETVRAYFSSAMAGEPLPAPLGAIGETALEPCGAWKGNYASCGRLPTRVRSGMEWQRWMRDPVSEGGLQTFPGAPGSAGKCPVSALANS